LTDNKGVTVDFKNTIIILTSNIGSAKILDIQDKEQRKKEVLDELKGYFRPEFLNRLDDIVIFEQLEFDAIVKIVDLLFAKIAQKVATKGITISLTQEAKEFIAKEGFDPVYGARPLQRALYEIVEDTLAQLILEDKIKEQDIVEFVVKDNNIAVKVNSQEIE
jgi:ATP-dependent Clp protease ATP-binding subunit ClpB